MEVPKDPSFVQIARAAHRTSYLLDHRTIIKGYNSETARWEKSLRQSMGRGQGASTISLYSQLSPISTYSLDLVSLGFYGDFMTQTCLIKPLAIGD